MLEMFRSRPRPPAGQAGATPDQGPK
jgi:hypothetical protein